MTGSGDPTLVTGRATGPITDPSLLDPAAELAPGTEVGRFVVQRRLGAGAMGVVYGAFDPELQREVALKLIRLRNHGDAERAEREERRLRREARAMAALDDSHTVGVHDVGVHRGRVFVAMELLEGGTLRDWLAARPPWPRVIEALLQAGRGLAAAHRRGLVHRDFKPDNVLVSADGRMLVSDFGLASAPSIESNADDADLHATRDAGTPAYMAPEQFAGSSISATSDQFSFCVTAWEALYGQRPYRGASVAELAVAVTRGDRRPVPASPVPAAVRRVLERGLHPSPERRWPDMDTLILELRRAARRRRGRRLAIAATLVAGCAGLWLASRGTACNDGRARVQAHLDRVSNDAWSGTVAPGSSEADHLRRAEAAIGAWADEWVAVHDARCVAGDEPDSGVMTCLDDRLAGFGELVSALGDGRTTPEASVSAALSLPPATDCVHAPPPPDEPESSRERAIARRLRTTGARAAALASAGRYSDARDLLETVLAQSRALEPAQEALRVQQQLGLAHLLTGRPDLASSMLEHAYWSASAAGHDALAADLASDVLNARTTVNDFSGVETWVQHSEATALRVDGGDGLSTARHLAAVCALRNAQQRFLEAYTACERASALYDRDRPGSHVANQVRANFAGTLSVIGRAEDAVELSDSVLAYFESRYGPRHPEVLKAKFNRATAELQTAADPAAAIASAEAALAAFEASPTDNSAWIVDAWQMLGTLSAAADENEEAIAAFRRARELAGPHDDIRRSKAHMGIGAAFHALGRLDEALAEYSAAIELLEPLEGSAPRLAWIGNNLASVLAEQGDLEAAFARFEATAALCRAHRDALPMIGFPLGGMGEVRAAQGRHEEAAVLLESSIPWLDLAGDAGPQAEGRFMLAEELWILGHDRVRARALVEQARTIAAASPPAIARADQWLRDHPPPQ